MLIEMALPCRMQGNQRAKQILTRKQAGVSHRLSDRLSTPACCGRAEEATQFVDAWAAIALGQEVVETSLSNSPPRNR